MRDLLAALRSVLFYAGYALSLLLFTPFCLLFGWLLPIRPRYRAFVLWNRFALFWLRLCCGVRYEVLGEENLPAAPYVMASNHQSPWETIFLYQRYCPLCAILKKELLSIPFFGWSLRLLEPIAIDRSRRREARGMLLSQGRARLAEGLSVLVFPEGTRVDPGQEKAWSHGAAELAITGAVPIVPVAHNAGVYWPARRLVKYPGTIQVRIGPALSTQGREPRELTQALYEWTRATLAALDHQPRR